MKVDLSKLNLKEQPTLLLKNLNGNIIAPLNPVLDIQGTLSFNETSEINFKVPKFYDGKETPAYDAICGMRIVEWMDIGRFVLVNPKITDEGIREVKECTIYSLEYELTYKKLSLENNTYNFYNPAAPQDTVLGIIVNEYATDWSVGEVDSELLGKWRTFEVTDANVLDFMRSTLQETYNCIFDFDTFNRKINVRYADKDVIRQPVYLSTDNLLNQIQIEEDTEQIVTSLDVNGAEGVTIRSVNPMGINKIYNLDYFMANDYDFTNEMKTKYQNWKDTFKSNQELYYNLTTEQIVQISRLNTEKAALVDLKGELSNFEAQLAVNLQAISQGIDIKEETIQEIRDNIDKKQAEIDEKQALIDSIDNELNNTITPALKQCNQNTALSAFFNAEELALLKRYLKEDSISDSNFVAPKVSSFNNFETFQNVPSTTFQIDGSKITKVKYSDQKTFYSIREGTLTYSYTVDDKTISCEAEIIRGTFEKNSDNKYIFSCYLSTTTLGDQKINSGSISFVGQWTNAGCPDEKENVADENGNLYSYESFTATVTDTSIYFTQNVSDYQQRQIEWELYEYGQTQLNRLASPSYTFTLDSQDFLALDDFVAFKNEIQLGNSLYVKTSMGIKYPILLSIGIDYSSIAKITLNFGSTFYINDPTFKQVDLVKQSVSMGKTVDFNKYNYSRFVDSGAESSVRSFMNSALDVSKNSIMSSTNQDISWDGTGFKLRKTDGNGGYTDKQTWFVNNSIMMTDDNWQTAKVAIGEMSDGKNGTIYGIAADMIMGKLIAGENLIIESYKSQDGKTIQTFKVDGDGVKLYNGNFTVANDRNMIIIDPDKGFVIGTNRLISYDDDGNEIYNESERKVYTDTDGNVYFSGVLQCGYDPTTETYNFMVDKDGNVTANNGVFTNGTFNGHIQATSLSIGGESVLDGDGKIKYNYINLGKLKLDGTTGDITLTGNITWDTDDTPVQVRYSATNLGNPTTDPTSWHDIFNAETDKFASYSYNGGNAWSNPVKVVGTDGLPGKDGTDANVTDEAIFNLLTDNGNKVGIFNYSGNGDSAKLMINADYIKTGFLNADRIKSGCIVSDNLSMPARNYFKGKFDTNNEEFYLYIRFSANSNGSNMTFAPQSSSQYIGIFIGYNEKEPDSYSSYTWTTWQSNGGITPVLSLNNKDNTETIYITIRFSDDGKTFNTKSFGTYVGIYMYKTGNASSTFDDYTWYKYVSDTIEFVDPEIFSKDYTNAGSIFNLDNGSIYTPNFRIDGSSVYCKGNILGSTMSGGYLRSNDLSYYDNNTLITLDENNILNYDNLEKRYIDCSRVISGTMFNLGRGQAVFANAWGFAVDDSGYHAVEIDGGNLYFNSTSVIDNAYEWPKDGLNYLNAGMKIGFVESLLSDTSTFDISSLIPSVKFNISVKNKMTIKSANESITLSSPSSKITLLKTSGIEFNGYSYFYNGIGLADKQSFYVNGINMVTYDQGGHIGYGCRDSYPLTIYGNTITEQTQGVYRVASGGDIHLSIQGLNTDTSGDVTFWTTNGYYILSPNIVANTTQLGSSTYRWYRLYAQNACDTSSDERLKTEILPFDDNYKIFFSKLKPIHYKRNDIEDKRIRFGFIAQDVEDAFIDSGLEPDKYDILNKYSNDRFSDGIEYSLAYEEFIALNTMAIQDLQKEIIALKNELKELKSK